MLATLSVLTNLWLKCNLFVDGHCHFNQSAFKTFSCTENCLNYYFSSLSFKKYPQKLCKNFNPYVYTIDELRSARHYYDYTQHFIGTWGECLCKQIGWNPEGIIFDISSVIGIISRGKPIATSLSIIPQLVGANRSLAWIEGFRPMLKILYYIRTPKMLEHEFACFYSGTYTVQCIYKHSNGMWKTSPLHRCVFIKWPSKANQANVDISEHFKLDKCRVTA